jgi:hypothetical protein
MRGIEGAISDAAPPEFPNRVLPDGSPENVDDRLDLKIERLENEICAKLDNFASALQVSRSAMETEQEMIRQADIAYSRWVDLKAPVRRALRRGRLLYLKALVDATGD